MKTHNWKLLRRIFMVAIAFIVLFEVGALLRRIPGHLLIAILAEIPTGTMIGMILVGLAAVSLPVWRDKLLYDVLEPDKKTPWVLTWTINVINNGIGSLNFVSNWLHRRALASRQTDANATLNRVWWYGTTGWAVLSLLGLILAGMTHMQSPLSWILLSLGLTLPLVGLFLTRFGHQTSAPISKRQYTQLFLANLLADTGWLIAFLGFGLLFHLPVQLLQTVPIIIAARMFGLITLIPGGWGTFDLFVIIGLTDVGVDPTISFLWIVLYRTFYTLGPFLIGLLIAASRGLRTLNANYRGAPADIFGSIAQRVVVGLLYFAGITMIVVGVIPGTLEQFPALVDFSPWANNLFWQLPNWILGVLLIVAGRAIAYRVQRAFVPTITLLVLTTIFVTISRTHWQPIVILSATLLLTMFIKPKLYRRQFIYSVEAQLFDGFVLGAIILTYIWLGVSHLPVVNNRFHFSSRGLLMLPSVHWWVIGFVIIILTALISLAFLNYLRGRVQLLGEPLDEDRYSAVLAQGDNHYASLAFLGDKRLFYYRATDTAPDSVALQFRLYNNKAAVMSDPVGVAADFKPAIAAFIQEADALGYLPIFYEVSEPVAMIAHEFGYNFMKLGEEARVDTTTFKTAGKKFANIRSEINQATAAGFEYDVVLPPFSADFLAELKAISDTWLDGREEKGYSLGFFKESYLQRDGIAILRSATGQIEAFASLVTSKTENQMAVDLMRFTRDAPNGTMDVLFVKTFDYARDNGYGTFNLGMSPLAGVGAYDHSFIKERVANLIFQFGSSIYSFEGLQRYKKKFATNWQPYYISYSSRSNIIFNMLALLMIDNPGVDMD
jgi:phosphatidylglycerol lysyltransferase